jgi:carbon-monoxide dehydrogenase small subunit
LKKKIRFTLNGRATEVAVDKGRTLLWVLRTELGLTGTKYGCGKSLCGTCTVLVDKKATSSCRTAMEDVAGKSVVTIEGLARNGKLHPVQEAFIAHDALQCGFCTPGMILAAVDLLRRKPKPSREEIVSHMDGNLCRCGAHTRIIDAILAASKDMKGAALP